MKEIYLFLFAVFAFFCSCKNLKNTSLTHQVLYDSTLTDSFYYQNNWSYPSMTTKDDLGHFDNGYGGKISAKNTLHLLHTAAIVRLFDSRYKDGDRRLDCNDCQIDFGEARLLDDSLMLNFYDATPSFYDDLQIHIVNHSFSSTYESGTPVGGNKFYPFDQQKLVLQKDRYAKGDTIKGYLDFQGRTHKFVSLKGFFKILVQ